jgi:F-type H+-transporting ATPase subunit b
MKSGTDYRQTKWLIFLIVLGLLLWSQAAWASAGAAASWRPTYDIAMKWLNFFILSFVIVKYARTPLKTFLAGQKDKVQDEIQSLEEKRSALQSQVAEAQQQLAESDAHFAELKEKIVQQAEKEKERVIESAKEQSRLMIESAQQRVESRIQHAKASVISELIDNAVSGALEKLPAIITAEDDQKYLDRFMSEVEAA